MRFDFSHKAQVTQAELEKIEGISQDWVRRNVGVYARELALPVAQKIYSLRAVFGESYPDPVRVVSLEYDVAEIAADLENPKWRKTSIELCGGTYVNSAPPICAGWMCAGADCLLAPPFECTGTSRRRATLRTSS